MSRVSAFLCNKLDLSRVFWSISTVYTSPLFMVKYWLVHGARALHSNAPAYRKKGVNIRVPAVRQCGDLA